MSALLINRAIATGRNSSESHLSKVGNAHSVACGTRRDMFGAFHPWLGTKMLLGNTLRFTLRLLCFANFEDFAIPAFGPACLRRI